MKIKEKKWPFVVLGCVILLLYVLFSNYPLKKEIYLIPQWTINLKDIYEASFLSPTDDKNALSKLQETFPFVQGNYLGRVDSAGNLSFIEYVPEMATISNTYWATYSRDAKNTLIHHMDGTEPFFVKEEGFPFAVNDFLCTFFPGGNTFGFYDTEGSLLWTASQWSPITAFSVSSDAIAVGYIDGNLRLFSTDGTVLFSTYPAGSSYEVIYGAALSSDSTLLAAISGLDTQRFVLYEVDKNNSKIIYHEYLETQQITERFIQFNTENTKVYYEKEGGLISFSIKDKKAEFIALPGKICKMQELQFEQLLSVLSKENGTWYVSFLDRYNELVAQFSFDAKTASLFSYQNAVYLGYDDFISKMEIVRK